MLAQSLPYLALPGRTHLLVAGIALSLVTLLVVVGRLMVLGRHRPQPPAPAPRDFDTFITCGPLEKRHSTRRRGSLVEVLVTDAGLSARPVRGWVHDRSLGGLCLVLDRSITVSTILHLRAAEAQLSTPWVQVTVRNCRAWEGKWMLGCQFIKTPQWAVLLTFG
jgi:hypothetical protein